MSQSGNTENSCLQDQEALRTPVEYEKIEQILVNMSTDPNLLKAGYNLISVHERNRNFYLNFLKVIFASATPEKVKKLAASTLKIFLTKNWSDDSYITNEERLVTFFNLDYCECPSLQH